MLNESIIIDGKKITRCEFEILQLLVQGMLRKEIANTRCREIKTIDTQLMLLYRKLGVPKLAKCVAWALTNGFDKDGNYTAVQPIDPKQEQINAALQLQRGIAEAKAKEKRKKK